MEPGWGGRSTARRPVVAVDIIFLRHWVPVKRFNHEVALPPAAIDQSRSRCPAGRPMP